VLADPPSEDDCIQPVERRDHGADPTGKAMNENVDCECCPRVATVAGGYHVGQVCAYS
jgi:hypothetical protein